MRAAGMAADPWQERLLRERPRRGLLLCSRQIGKSTAAAASAGHEAVYWPESLILMLAPTQRQSGELLRKTRFFLSARSLPTAITAVSSQAIELANGSRVISLPATEDTIRGFSAATLIVIDEAARVPDEPYFALRPMLATSDGRLLALSTPNGQRGWFYHAWVGNDTWTRIKVTAPECLRIDPDFLAEERRNMTPTFYASEYLCEFGDTIDSVFAFNDVQVALDPTLTPLFPKRWR
jgi:hypothetical protein